jgi:hypothetical protein
LAGSLIGTVVSNDRDGWKPGVGPVCFVGIVAGALLVAAGLVGRRTPKPS